MSDSAAEAVNGEVVPHPKAPKGAAKPGFFARILIFIRQVIAEIKKVVTPTRNEYINYVIVVIAFVLIVMAFVLGIDFLIGKGVGFVFG